MRYFFIINPISGHTEGPDFYERTIREFMKESKTEFGLALSNAKDHTRELASRAASEGWDAVVAVGGDGTVNEAGSALIGSRAALGILPKGSGNGLAGELGLSRDPKRSLRTLLDSRPMKIDAGKVNGRIFLNLAGIGLDACVGHKFNRSKRRGRLPYFYMTASEMLRYKPSFIDIVTPEHTYTLKTLLIVVANGRQYGAGAVIAPKAKLNDGLFHVTAAPAMPLWKIVLSVPRIFAGSVDQVDSVKTLTTSHLILRLPEPLPYHLDGEPFQDASELKFEILPQSLNLLVPPSYPTV